MTDETTETTETTEKQLTIINRITRFLTESLFYSLLIGNLLSIIILWNYEFDNQLTQSPILLNEAIRATAEGLLTFAIIVSVMGAVIWFWYKLFHKNAIVFLEGIQEEFEEIIFGSFVWLMIGFIAVGITASFNEIVGFVSLFFYITGYGWWASDKYMELKYIIDNPELKKLRTKRTEAEIELTKYYDDIKTENSEEATKKYTEIASLNILIDEYTKNNQ